jgi:hypothetical protein
MDQLWRVVDADNVDDMEVYDLRCVVDRIERRSARGMAVGDYFELENSAHLTDPRGVDPLGAEVLPALRRERVETAEAAQGAGAAETAGKAE